MLERLPVLGHTRSAKLLLEPGLVGGAPAIQPGTTRVCAARVYIAARASALAIQAERPLAAAASWRLRSCTCSEHSLTTFCQLAMQPAVYTVLHLASDPCTSLYLHELERYAPDALKSGYFTCDLHPGCI